MKKKTKKTAKKVTRLSDKEKAIIKKMTAAGATMRTIAAKINRMPSTVWRWQQKL